jgi:TPR repeat protein
MDFKGTIIIMRENNRDYWLCSIDGTVEFRYPQADSNDPHAIYRLATILLDGYGVIPNPSKGMELLERCAKMGYKHAIKRLQMPRHSTDPSDTGEPGILPPGNW